MSTKNGTKEVVERGVGESALAEVQAEALIAAWMVKGGIELATQKVSVLRDLVGEKIAEARAATEAARAEIAARSSAMEAHFAALGFPGGPPIDDAEKANAKVAGIKRVKPTPPADDADLRKALVQRILVLKRDKPKDDPPTTRGLAKWSGATGQRIELVLKEAPEVRLTADLRWIPREGT
ncbi:MAG TPA: hypothetical protein VLE24_01680 [Methyloceanibacter sp.]|nr:hypothetical protein [Methyloceanibacter sp.]